MLRIEMLDVLILIPYFAAIIGIGWWGHPRGYETNRSFLDWALARRPDPGDGPDDPVRGISRFIRSRPARAPRHLG